MLFLLAIRRVLNCPKIHVMITALVSTWFAVRYAAADLPPTQRASLWIAFIAAVAIALREVINAWTEEDVAKVRSSGPRVQGSGFRVQETSGDTLPRAAIGNTPAAARSPQRVVNRPSPTPLNPEPRALPPRPPDMRPVGKQSPLRADRFSPSPLSPQSSALSPDSSPRSPMPPRTKLPLIVLALLPALALTGCQPCPELAVYREGLHAIDEPLYQAHLLLLDDAVKANLRTDVDRQVVQKGIDAARGLYGK
jgi:hypothetical protein